MRCTTHGLLKYPVQIEPLFLGYQPANLSFGCLSNAKGYDPLHSQ